MNSGKYVFAQLLQFVSRYEFEKRVKRCNGNYHVRNLNCWNQFVQLFFVQLTSRNSLRDICTCLKAHINKLYHLGIKQNVNQSSLSHANELRDWRIFADFGEHLIKLVRPLYSNTPIPNIDINNVGFPEIRPFKIRVGQARQSGRVRINFNFKRQKGRK